MALPYSKRRMIELLHFIAAVGANLIGSNRLVEQHNLGFSSFSDSRLEEESNGTPKLRMGIFKWKANSN